MRRRIVEETLAPMRRIVQRIRLARQYKSKAVTERRLSAMGVPAILDSENVMRHGRLSMSLNTVVALM